MVVLVLLYLQQKWSDLVMWLGFGMENSFGPPFPSKNLSAWGQISTRNFIGPIILEEKWKNVVGIHYTLFLVLGG